MSFFKRLRSWVSSGLDSEPIGLSQIELNPPELFELRMRRASQARAVDEAWRVSRRVKAPVIQFHKPRLVEDQPDYGER